MPMKASRASGLRSMTCSDAQNSGLIERMRAMSHPAFIGKSAAARQVVMWGKIEIEEDALLGFVLLKSAKRGMLPIVEFPLDRSFTDASAVPTAWRFHSPSLMIAPEQRGQREDRLRASSSSAHQPACSALVRGRP
jgi:hypothetical protein